MDFSSLVSSILDLLKDIFFWMPNQLIKMWASIFNYVIDKLPAWSGFSFGSFGDVPYTILGYLNWFLPVDVFMYCVTAFTTSLGLYFTVGIVTRWLKVTS